MNTREAATKLGYTDGYVTQLVRDGKLSATRPGGRALAFDAKTIETYRRKRDRIGSAIEDETGSPDPANASTAYVPAISDSEIAESITELDKEAIAVGGEAVSMAKLFWWMSEFLLAGMENNSIFPTAMAVLPAGLPDARAKAANMTARELMFTLRSLGLVRDENRTGQRGGYTVVVCTELGARVVRALKARGWARPRL